MTGTPIQNKLNDYGLIWFIWLAPLIDWMCGGTP